MIVLKIEQLSKSFNGVRAVQDVSLSVESGTIAALIGGNGAGKTTLFNLISGFEKNTEGAIFFEGKDITRFSALQRSQLGIARMFQQPRPFGSLDLMDNLLAAKHGHPGEVVWNYLFQKKNILETEKKIKKKAESILDTIGLAEKRENKAGELSLGQQKLLCLGMLLMNEPKLLLLDEPFAGLNPAIISEINVILRRLTDSGMAVMIVEHNIRAIKSISDCIFDMQEGRLTLLKNDLKSA